jgi:O-antigen ligase
VTLNPEAIDVVIAGSVVAVACLLRPAWIVPTFIALTWMAIPAAAYGGLPSPVEVGGAVLLGYAGWRATREHEVAEPVLIVTALFGFAALGASLASPEGSSVPVKWLTDLAFFVIAGLAVRGAGDVDRVAVGLCAVGAFLSLGAMYSVLVGPTGIFQLNDAVSGPEAARAAGPFGESNFFALSLAAIGPLAVYMLTGGGWRRGLGIFTMCCLIGGVFATGSRGGALALAAGLICAWLALTARRKRTLVLSLLAVAALLPLFSAQITSSGERTISGRATENQIAVAMFDDHPVSGVGVDVYPTLYRSYSREIGNDPRQVRAPHSLPLQIAAEQGVLGIVAWLAAGTALVGYVVGRGLWRMALGRAVILSLAAYGIGSLFLQGSQINLLFILAGLVFALGSRGGSYAPAASARLELAGASPP